MTTPTTYAAIADWKARMPNIALSDTARDAAIQGYLNASANQVDNYTGRNLKGVELFSATTSLTRYFDDRLDLRGMQLIDDAITITAVVRGTVTIDSAFWKGWPAADDSIEPFTHLLFRADAAWDYAQVVAGGGWYGYPFKNAGAQQLAVTGTWGYCTQANRPAEILEATCIQAEAMYEFANLSAKDRIQAIVNPYKGLVPMAEALIKPYKREAYF